MEESREVRENTMPIENNGNNPSCSKSKFTITGQLFLEEFELAKSTWTELVELSKQHAEEMAEVTRIVGQIVEAQKQGQVSNEQVREANNILNFIKLLHVFKDDGRPRYTAEEILEARRDARDVTSETAHSVEDIVRSVLQSLKKVQNTERNSQLLEAILNNQAFPLNVDVNPDNDAFPEFDGDISNAPFSLVDTNFGPLLSLFCRTSETSAKSSSSAPPTESVADVNQPAEAKVDDEKSTNLADVQPSEVAEVRITEGADVKPPVVMTDTRPKLKLAELLLSTTSSLPSEQNLDSLSLPAATKTQSQNITSTSSVQSTSCDTPPGTSTITSSSRGDSNEAMTNSQTSTSGVDGQDTISDAHISEPLVVVKEENASSFVPVHSSEQITRTKRVYSVVSPARGTLPAESLQCAPDSSGVPSQPAVTPLKNPPDTKSPLVKSCYKRPIVNFRKAGDRCTPLYSPATPRKSVRFAETPQVGKKRSKISPLKQSSSGGVESRQLVKRICDSVRTSEPQLKVEPRDVVSSVQSTPAVANPLHSVGNAKLPSHALRSCKSEPIELPHCDVNARQLVFSPDEALLSFDSHGINTHVGPPQSIFNPPQSIVHPPKSIVNPPQSIFNPPQSIVHPPKSIVNPPQSIVNPPQSIVNPPQSIVNPPHSSVNPPQSIVNPPQSIVNPPQSVRFDSFGEADMNAYRVESRPVPTAPPMHRGFAPVRCVEATRFVPHPNLPVEYPTFQPDFNDYEIVDHLQAFQADDLYEPMLHVPVHPVVNPQMRPIRLYGNQQQFNPHVKTFVTRADYPVHYVTSQPSIPTYSVSGSSTRGRSYRAYYGTEAQSGTRGSRPGNYRIAHHPNVVSNHTTASYPQPAPYVDDQRFVRTVSSVNQVCARRFVPRYEISDSNADAQEIVSYARPSFPVMNVYQPVHSAQPQFDMNAYRTVPRYVGPQVAVPPPGAVRVSDSQQTAKNVENVMVPRAESF